MAQYWETCPCPSAADMSKTANVPPSLAKCRQLLKDFHCHCEWLAQQDTTHEVEDWQSELQVYLRVVAKEVLPETDVVKWWQVCCMYVHCYSCLTMTRIMRQSIQLLLALCSTTSHPRHLLFHANGFFLQPNKQLLTGVHISALRSLNSCKSSNLRGTVTSPILQFRRLKMWSISHNTMLYSMKILPKPTLMLS
jgi:hypothetical protein